MLIEKLFLNVLIILAPILIQAVLSDQKKVGNSPYFWGLLHGIAAFLCMIFSYYSVGLYWDLRYIPLVIAVLYGGPKAGLIVLGFILTARTINGGDAILYGYASALFATLIPLLASKRFWKLSPDRRVIFSIIIGIWPTLVMLCILLVFGLYRGIDIAENLFVFSYVIIFGIFQIIAFGVASKLHEWMLEKQYMREEIIRSEKQHTLGELAASIAHEVRNPLTVVKGFLQLMQGERQKDHTDYHYLSIILAELGRAEIIINDYLNFAKPQFEKLEQVSIKEQLSDIMTLMHALAMKEGVYLRSKIYEEAYIYTDRNKLKQAFINLIKNAIEATGQSGSVTVTLTIKEDHLTVVVEDTGKGMSKEQLSRIGTLFYTTKDKGTGLGTTVSLRIIEALGGNTDYESELGEGTKVTVTLPIQEMNKIKEDAM